MATFCIEAIEATDIALVKIGSPTIGTVHYGVNDSTVPNAYTVTTEGVPIHLTAGQKCYWTIANTTESFKVTDYLNFKSTGKIRVGGNLNDLIGGVAEIPRSRCFFRLFSDCVWLVSARDLVMVANLNSKTYTYSGMFQRCTSLIEAPKLPATTLTSYCYSSMFQMCTSLIEAPELPATTIANYCYSDMFYKCTALTNVPELPATTLANNCYSGMFSDCTSLKLYTTETPEHNKLYRIPSSGNGTVGSYSLDEMFSNTGGDFTGTPTINTNYYLYEYAKNVKFYDGIFKLYPVTKAENVIGGLRVATATVTLTAAGWINNTQTINVTGVTASNLVQVSAASKADADAWTAGGVWCTAQENGTLTFQCDETPAESLSVNVVVFGGGLF